MKGKMQNYLSINEYDLCPPKPIYTFFKRLFDIICSSLGLVLLSWLFVIIMILVKCTSKGPIFYGHMRVGKKGKLFKVYKFRTMINDDRPIEKILTKEQYEEYKTNYKVSDDPRITKIGKILRKTSLDELPQLLNIFLGQMSIVGWRPIILEELQKYEDKKYLLITVKPGLTGYWASHGRSNTSYEERMEMELYYVKNRNFALDFSIIFKTFFAVFKEEGAK